MSIYDKSSLVLIPSGTKTSKVYSQKPTNGDGDFDFTRSTAATRIAANGNIEKETQNLLLQSNSFDTTWVKSSSTVTSGQAGYDNSNDAWLLEKSGAYGRLDQTASFSGVQTFSVYAKLTNPTEANCLTLRVDIPNNIVQTTFNLETQVVDDNNGFGSIIEQVGDDGWYRCSTTYIGNSIVARIYVALNGQTNLATGSLLIQDAQIEQGLAATPYIETTTTTAQAGVLENTPRLNYTTGVANPYLLLEPSRTNLVTNSEYMPSFSIGGDAIISLANVINPQGTLSSYQVTSINNGSRIQQTIGPQGNNFVYSGFFKGTGVATRLRIANNLGNEIRCDIGANGIFTIQSTTSTNYGIEDYGNGWHRIYFETTTSSAANNFLQVYPDSNDGNGSIYVWGLQAEQGTYPTSYIPTYSVSATRAADSSEILSIQSNGIVGATDSYTIFFDISNDDGGNAADGGNSQWLKGQDSSYSNIWTLRKQDTADQKYHSLYYNKDADYVFSSETINKGCFVFTTNEVKVFLDGSLNTTYSVANSPLNLNGILIDYGSSDRTTIKFSQLLLFPTALSDADCITLTTI